MIGHILYNVRGGPYTVHKVFKPIFMMHVTLRLEYLEIEFLMI